MKILITGANGYIGSNIVKELCNRNYEVIVADINNSFIDTRAKFIKCDIFGDNDNWFSYFGEPDVCLHLAWRDGFKHNSILHIKDLPSHYCFLENLVTHGLKHLTVLGSMHEIGYYEGAINENTICNPKSLYGISKNTLRQSLEILCENITFQWIRAFYIFGDDLVGNSIFCKIREAVNNNQKTFPFTTGKNKFDFIHINELVDQIIAVITQNYINGIINCCSGTPISLADKVESYIVQNNLPIKLQYGAFPDRPYDSPCVYGDNTKIKQILFRRNSRILVTGVNGQLGYDCVKELKSRGYLNIKTVDVNDMDITNKKEVFDVISYYKPSVIIHNAAFTAVDKAEVEKNLAFDVNVNGTKYLVEAAKLNKSKFVYISTDYVFDGQKNGVYEETDQTNPLSIYGKTKLKGEEIITNNLTEYFILRTSWVFGINGNNFIKTMLKLAKDGKKELNVVCDQVGSPTYTVDLAKIVVDVIETDKYGIYHVTNEGYCSWFEFAKKIFEVSNVNLTVNPVTTEQYLTLVKQQAIRPMNSKMSKTKLKKNGFTPLPSWEDALNRYLYELGGIKNV